ncbi:MAG TPA: hypothetical protein VEA81_11665 [Burkholderiaceae bacterium]|nr:hypothetical protein [Burkholderiaceae bacterium]
MMPTAPFSALPSTFAVAPALELFAGATRRVAALHAELIGSLMQQGLAPVREAEGDPGRALSLMRQAWLPPQGTMPAVRFAAGMMNVAVDTATSMTTLMMQGAQRTRDTVEAAAEPVAEAASRTASQTAQAADATMRAATSAGERVAAWADARVEDARVLAVESTREVARSTEREAARATERDTAREAEPAPAAGRRSRRAEAANSPDRPSAGSTRRGGRPAAAGKAPAARRGAGTRGARGAKKPSRSRR